MCRNQLSLEYGLYSVTAVHTSTSASRSVSARLWLCEVVVIADWSKNGRGVSEVHTGEQDFGRNISECGGGL